MKSSPSKPPLPAAPAERKQEMQGGEIPAATRAVDFSADEVRTLRAKQKTQVRVLMSSQPDGQPVPDPDGKMWYVDGGMWCRRCPFGDVGDTLRVREPWAPSEKGLVLLADSYWGDPEDAAQEFGVRRWRSPKTLPREASRFLLETVSIRCERMQSISESDARAEGVGPEFEMDLATFMSKRTPVRSTYALGFKHHWCRKYGSNDAWNANAWLWVIDFRLIGRTANWRGGAR